MIADDVVKNVHLGRTEWVYLREGQGLTDVQRSLRAGQWRIEGIKVVVLITGQAEASAGHQAMTNMVASVMGSVHEAYPHAVILLCALIPRPRDGPLVLNDLRDLSDSMHEVCKEQSYYEYSRLGAFFYGKFRILGNSTGTGGAVMAPIQLIKEHLMDRDGLTLKGARLIQTCILEKIKSANLFERYIMLSSNLINL